MRGYSLLKMLVTAVAMNIVDGFLSAPGKPASTGQATIRARASSPIRWPESRHQIGGTPTERLVDRTLLAVQQDANDGGGLLEAMRHLWRQFERDASTYSMMKVSTLFECKCSVSFMKDSARSSWLSFGFEWIDVGL